MPDVNIIYKGLAIATMSDSGKKTLSTAGTFCEDNIEITYNKTVNTVISSSTWYLDANNNLVI